MSAKATFWAWRQDLKAPIKVVLLGLADTANHDDECWPAHKWLAAKCGVSAATVGRAILELENSGRIERVSNHRADGSQTSNRYRLRTDDYPSSDRGPIPAQSEEAPSSDRGPMNLLNEPTQQEPTCVPGAGTDRHSDIARVWSHFVAMRQRSPKKIRAQALDPATRRMIEGALKVATADELCKAVDAMLLSKHHVGENDRGKTYLEPHHIFTGRSGRTTRGQIDLFLDLAEKAAGEGGNTSADPARLAQAKRMMLDAWEFPGSEQARRQGEMGAAWLAQHGYVVELDPATGRPTFKDAA